MQGAHFHPFIQERYRSDQQFQLEIDYCAEGRLKHSEFLDWPELDQEKALIWLREQRLKCPDCGTISDESDPSKGGDFAAYHLDRFTCFACKNIEDAYADERKRGRRKTIAAGFKVRLIPNRVYQERKRIKKQMEILKLKREALQNQTARLERTRSNRS